MKTNLFLLLCLLAASPVAAGSARIESIQVRTRAPENRTVTVHFRIPANYDPEQAGLSRVLILFGGRNTDGRDASNGFLIGGSIPLFSSKNKVKTAKARHTEARMRQTEAAIKAESSARALIDKMGRLDAAMKAYDVPLMRQTLSLLRTAVENGQISVTDYYVEADNVYRNLLAYMDVERQYHGVVADITKNGL